MAPSDTGLHIAAELDSLRRQGLDVVSLEGIVTPERVFECVESGQFDIVHFACHTDEIEGEQRVMLSGVGFLTAGAVMQVARQCGALLVYLNACTTAITGQLLIDNHIPSTIVTIRPLDDGVAWQTASTFYRMLLRLGDLREAYNASRPAADGRYLWLSNGGYAEMMSQPVVDELKGLSASMAESKADRMSMHVDLQRLVWVVSGSALMAAATFVGLELHVWMVR